MKMIHSRLTSVEAIEDFYSRFQNAVSNGEDKGILFKQPSYLLGLGLIYISLHHPCRYFIKNI